MSDETKRIIDQPLDTELSAGDYVIVDSEESGVGSRRFDLGSELQGIKEDLQDLQEEIEGGGSGSGMSAEFKQALHNILEKVAYIDEDGQDYLNALDSAMYPPVTAISLNTNSLSFATLNSTQQLTATTTPTGGAVTWSSSNTSVATVSSSGLVTSKGYGSATITATSGSVSATCSVVVAQATLSSISAVYTQSGTVYDTDSLDSLKSDLVVTATWSDSSTSTVASTDYTLSGTLTEGTSTITVSYGGKTTTFTVVVTVAPFDTTPIITDYDKRFSNSGALSNQVGMCVTDFYELNDSKITIHNFYTEETAPYSVANLLVYDSEKAVKNHWNASISTERIIDFSTYGTFPFLRVSLYTSGVNDCYCYETNTGKVLFAGEDSPYYGMHNISEAS